MKKQLIKYRYILHAAASRLMLFVRKPSSLVFYIHYYLIVPMCRRKRGVRSPEATIVSYPKSGRTWLEDLLCELAKLKHNVSSSKVTTLRELLDRYEDLPYIDFTHAGSSWESYALTDDEILSVPARKWARGKVLFLWRDPKDTLVSSYYHLLYRTKIPWVQKKHLLEDPVVGIRKLVNFINLWSRYVEENPSSSIAVRYEDLKKDPVAVLQKICAFIGLNSSMSDIKAAVENTRFEKMQRREREMRSANPWITPGDPKNTNSYKARKGTVGESQLFFQPDELRILNRFIKQNLHISAIRESCGKGSPS